MSISNPQCKTSEKSQRMLTCFDTTEGCKGKQIQHKLIFDTRYTTIVISLQSAVYKGEGTNQLSGEICVHVAVIM
jgi:hypothetical protein